MITSPPALASEQPTGYGQEELERAGAYRVYQEPADLLRQPDEVGVRAAP